MAPLSSEETTLLSRVKPRTQWLPSGLDDSEQLIRRLLMSRFQIRREISLQFLARKSQGDSLLFTWRGTPYELPDPSHNLLHNLSPTQQLRTCPNHFDYFQEILELPLASDHSIHQANSPRK